MRDIGTPEDLPFLRELAENDMLKRKGPVSRKNEYSTAVDVGDTYPVREAAVGAIRAIELRAEK
jgi:hypothetical protein